MTFWRRPAWCDGPVLILFSGAFISSVGWLLVAPYLGIYLYQRDSVSATAVGLLLGLCYWSTRASGLAAGALATRLGPRRVMMLGNVLRTAGYLLLMADSVACIVVSLLLIGTGAGLFFPVAKAFLLRLVDDEHQMKAISARNALANSGAAIGPLLGLLVLVNGPRFLFAGAAVIFGALTLLLARLPELPAPSAGAGHLAGAARLLTRRTIVVIMLATALLGGAVIQIESAFPLIVASGPSDGLASVVFLINAVIVVAAQPIMLRVVTSVSGRQSMIGGFAAFAASFVLLSASAPLWTLWLAGVLIFSIAEVWISLWIDDRVRREEPSDVTTIYGLSGVSDAFGGLAGASLGATLVASAYWTLALVMLGLALLVCALMPSKRVVEVRVS